MAKSYCRRSGSIGNIFVSIFGKYNLLHAERKGNMKVVGDREKIDLLLGTVAALRRRLGSAFQIELREF